MVAQDPHALRNELEELHARRERIESEISSRLAASTGPAEEDDRDLAGMRSESESLQEQINDLEAAFRAASPEFDAAQATAPGDAEETEAASVAPGPSALQCARGKAVRVDDLLTLRNPDGDNALSVSVRGIFEIATETQRFRTPDDHDAIDLQGVVQALLFKAKAATGGETTENFFAEWLEGRGVRSGYPPATLPTTAFPGVLAAPDVTEILADAENILRATHDRAGEPVAVRHLFAAILLSGNGRRVLGKMNLTPATVTAYFPTLANDFIDYLAGTAAITDRLYEWGNLLAPLNSLITLGGSRTQLTKYNSDRPAALSTYSLGIEDDVRSLAELVCLEDSEPPLAIGLFGDWGSGKSTFMEVLRGEVNALTRDSVSGTNSPFVTNVSHIWFNAWHYNDANLWASLVSHIFRELHRQSTDLSESRNWLKEDQFKELLKQFDIVQESEREATVQLATLEKEITKTEEDLKKIEESRGEANKTLIKSYTSALIDSIEVKDPDHKVANAMDALGLGSEKPDARRLRDVVTEGQKLSGRAQLLFASMQGWRTPPFWYALIGLVVLLVIGGSSATVLNSLGSEAYFSGLREIAGTVGSVLGLACGAMAWLLPHMKFVNEKFGPLIDAHNKVMQDEKAAERARLEDERKAKEKLEDLKVEQLQKQHILEEKKTEQEHYEAIARGDKPEELLNYFIADRASTDDYKARLGLLSRIREDFVTMSDLMGDQRERRRNPGGIKGVVQPNLPQIDRIILYIDDLDRCRHDKVVEVLEAIHLLLAFDLFVVVVGVDARWLHRSLEQSYASQLSHAASGPNHFSGHATPGDYLEKIFQIPFWLKPLRFDQGGTYQKLVENLVGDVLVTKPQFAVTDPDAPAPPSDDDSGVGPGLETVEAEFPAPPEETEAETAARIQFTDVEVDLINELGPLAGKSPRAVKRMINLYRLIRVGFRGTALDAFLNDRDGVNYPEVLFWLAMETGCPRAGLANFIEYLQNFDGGIGALKSVITNPNSSAMITRQKDEGLRNALGDSGDKVVDALNAVNAARGDTLTVEDLRNAYPVTMRFSFQQEYSRTMIEE